MRTYGIIGFPLAHSFSKRYFDEKFKKEMIHDAVFEDHPIEHISMLDEWLKSTPSLEGFCITIPHKKNILPFLHEASDAVKKMGACNCVRVRAGKLYGYNTDVIGFENSFIQYLQPHHKKALILGTGGAAAAVEFVLQKLQIEHRFVSRKKQEDNFSYDELNKNILDQYSIIINTTPLGTYPKIDDAPGIPYSLLTPQHYLYDLVYNPPQTRFLQLGASQGAAIKNGQEMLELQAEENWKIWNDLIPIDNG